MTDQLQVIPYTGGQISVPGIYSGVPMHETDDSPGYHGDICVGPSFSSSHLRKMETMSPDEVWDTLYLNPDRDPDADKDKPHYVLGRAAHTLLLGEAGFAQTYLIRPETYADEKTGADKPWNGNSLVCKRWMAEAKEMGRTVITAEQVETIRGIARRLADHPTVQTGILNGLIEHSIFWIDEKTGLWLKARPDVIPTDSNVIADLKVQAGVTAIECRRSITDWSYHQQMALISEGMFRVAARVIEMSVLVMAKSSRPYSINHKPLTPAAIYRGHQLNRRALDRIKECLDASAWPGPDDDEVPAGLMEYREKQLDYESKHGLLPDIEEPSKGGAAEIQKARKTRPIELPEPGEAI